MAAIVDQLTQRIVSFDPTGERHVSIRALKPENRELFDRIGFFAALGSAVALLLATVWFLISIVI